MGKSKETESRLVVARGREWGNEELLFNGYRVSVLEDEKSSRGWMVVMVAQCDECLLPLNCMLKSGKDGEGDILED